MNPFRFGIMAEHARTPELLRDTAHRAESSGWSTLLLRDHLVEGPFEHQLAPLVSLTAVAGWTQRLRVGTLVLCNDFRHPAVLAKEAASLALLSGGRFELGVGAGFLRREYDQAGIAFSPPGERVSRLSESLHVLKALLACEPATHAGDHYSIAGLDGFPRVPRPLRPPIHVAGARRRMLSLAAREADIVGIQAVSTADGVLTASAAARSAATVAQQVGWVRSEAGARFAALELSTTATVVLTDDASRAAQRLAVSRGWAGVSVEEVLEMPSVFVGTPDQVTRSFQDRRARYGLSYFAMSDADLDAVSPVVERLAGR